MAVKAGVKQHKEKVISKVLRTGLVVLFICVVVGIILVVSLRETYLKRASEQYQALHVDSGALMDSILKRYGDQAALLARQLEGHPPMKRSGRSLSIMLR